MEWLATPETLTTMIATPAAVVFLVAWLWEARLTTATRAPRRRFTDLVSQTEQRGAPIVGKTVSNRERRVAMTETRRHKLQRCKASDDGADSILRKGRARRCLARGIRYKGPGRSCHG